MAVRIIPPNPIGLTHFAEYVDSYDRNGTLDSQLDKAGVPYRQVPIPHLVGINKSAELLLYTSPKSGKPVTVLCIIDRYEIDDFAVVYYYREGMTEEEAMKDEQFWLDFYSQARNLVRSLPREP